MSNTVLYKNTICPFRFINDSLQVFYKNKWINVKEKEVKSIN